MRPGIRLRPVLAALCLLMLLGTGGCARYDVLMESCLAEVRDGRAAEAVEKIEKSSLARSDRNRLLYLMEKGQLQYLAGQYDASVVTLEEADLLIEDLVSRSLSRESFSFVSNDKIIPYSGEDFETAYIHYVKALAFLARSDLSGAGVEARKIDIKLNALGDRYGEKNLYQEDGFLRLLTGLIYEASGDDNNAFIAYRKSLEAYQRYAVKYRLSVPDSLWARLIATADRMGFFEERNQYRAMADQVGKGALGRQSLLVVLVDNGCIPEKKQISSVFPGKHGFPVSVALPEYRERSRGASQIRVRVGQGSWVETQRVQSLAAIARQSLEDKIGRLLAKTIARVAAKQIAARAAEKEYGPLAGLLAQIGALMSEQADLRGWSMLPGTIEMAILTVPAGDIEVDISADGQQLRHSLNVSEGSIAFVHSRIF